MKISVIITSFNWAEALEQNILSLNQQSQKPDEVIVTDDGSETNVASMIRKLKNKVNFPIHFIWQQHHSFHNSRSRNKAIAKASGNYIIFLDQDNIANQYFIERHCKLAEEGYFCTHPRIMLRKKLTTAFFKQKFPLEKKSATWFFLQRLQNNVNKFSSTLNLPLNKLRNFSKKKWDGTACGLAVWKKDLIAVNGFDETYKGWGYEDSDLVSRLIQHGIYRKLANFSCIVYHLYHKTNFRSKEEKNKNLPKLQATLAGNITPFPGLDQHL